MEKQILSALIAILFALSGWALTSINTLQQDIAKIQVGHVTAESLHQLRRSVDRLEYILEQQSAEK